MARPKIAPLTPEELASATSGVQTAPPPPVAETPAVTQAPPPPVISKDEAKANIAATAPSMKPAPVKESVDPTTRYLRRRRDGRIILWDQCLADKADYEEVDADGQRVRPVMQAGKVILSSDPEAESDIPTNRLIFVQSSTPRELRRILFGAGIPQVPRANGELLDINDDRLSENDLLAAVITLETERAKNVAAKQ